MTYEFKNEEQQKINVYLKKMGYMEASNQVYQRWSKVDTTFLIKACNNGLSIIGIARHLGRTPMAIRLRIKKLGLNYRRPNL